MDEFLAALLSEKTDKIPQEYDWFAPLLGDWEFDYYDGYEKASPRHVKGEWLFRRVLEGAGIQDLFICPSRATKQADPQPDGEYGAALRMFDAAKKSYDMVYVCGRYIQRLEFKAENGKLVGTVLGNAAAKWVFSEITQDTFHWQNVTVLEDGTWRVNSNVYARRKT